MATAAEIAQACRQLANQVQSVHIPQMHAVISEVGSQVDHLATEGDEVFRAGLQPVQSSFHALSPHFQAITSFLEEHPSHLLLLAAQLEAIAGNNLVVGAGMAAAGAGNPLSGLPSFRSIFDPVNTAIGVASLMAYFRSNLNLMTTARDVADEIERQAENATDIARFEENASHVLGGFEHMAESDLRSGGLESLMGMVGVSGKAVDRVGLGLGAFGIFGDAMTLVHPDGKGAVALADRGAAAINAAGIVGMTPGLFGADALLATVPGVGEVALVGTGVFMTGDYLYQNVPAFRHATNDVVNAVGPVGIALAPLPVVGAVAVAGSALYQNVPEVRHATNDVFSAVGTAGGDVDHAAGSLWHAL